MFFRKNRNFSEFSREFKAGKFSFDIEEYILTEIISKIQGAVSYIKRKSLDNSSYLNNKTFIGALYKFITENPSLKWDSFMKKLELRCDVLRPITRSQDYNYYLQRNL